MAKIFIEYSEKELMDLIRKDIEDKLNISVTPRDIVVMVKSKQNYKSEWEHASFKAEYTHYK